MKMQMEINNYINFLLICFICNVCDMGRGEHRSSFGFVVIYKRSGEFYHKKAI